jgi:hypothetical protein
MGLLELVFQRRQSALAPLAAMPEIAVHEDR